MIQNFSRGHCMMTQIKVAKGIGPAFLQDPHCSPRRDNWKGGVEKQKCSFKFSCFNLYFMWILYLFFLWVAGAEVNALHCKKSLYMYLGVFTSHQHINSVGTLLVLFICKWSFLVFYHILHLRVIENGIETRLAPVNQGVYNNVEFSNSSLVLFV